MDEKKSVNLSKFNNGWYQPGGNAFTRVAWYLVNAFVFRTYLFPFYSVKSSILRLFGASVGKGLVIKPSVNIKYPWHLKIGNNVWIGEDVWIDNLAETIIGNNVCISQGAMLLTGNHNYKKVTFDLIVKGIVLEDGVWIGARSTVCPGVTCGTHSVLSVGSVATRNMEPFGIYTGLPAAEVSKRIVDQ